MGNFCEAAYRPIQLGWYKLSDAAIIPTKTEKNAGFDIYTIEKDVMLMPHEHKLFATGLAAVVEPGWWLMAMDRGSTGSKGVHIHCGVIDNNYRGEIFICLNNDNDFPIKFTDAEEPGLHSHKEQMHDPVGDNGLAYRLKTVEVIDYLVYPISKAIAQIMLVPQPDINSRELTSDEWDIVKDTDRGDGKLGSSGK